jgi:hypothetical protein
MLPAAGLFPLEMERLQLDLFVTLSHSADASATTQVRVRVRRVTNLFQEFCQALTLFFLPFLAGRSRVLFFILDVILIWLRELSRQCQEGRVRFLST